MKTYRVSLILLTLATILSACGGGGAASSDDPAVAVIEGMEAAWNAKDLDAVMALYAEDAVETNGLGTFTGKSQIRGMLDQAMKTFALDCGNYKVNGSTVTYDCVLKSYGTSSDITETYDTVIENGKIKSNILTATK